MRKSNTTWRHGDAVTRRFLPLSPSPHLPLAFPSAGSPPQQLHSTPSSVPSPTDARSGAPAAASSPSRKCAACCTCHSRSSGAVSTTAAASAATTRSTGPMSTSPAAAGRQPEPDQGPLFTRQGDTETRGQGDNSIAPSPTLPISPSCSLPSSTEVSARIASERYRRILRSISNNGPSTLFELCDRFDVTPNQISGRLTELKRMLLLAIVGQKPHPKSGAACDILDLTPQGRTALKEGTPL